MSAFYDDPSSFPFIERAILTEDITLPILNKKKSLTRKFFYSLRRLASDPEYGERTWFDEYYDHEYDYEYKLAYNEIKNIDGKFIIPVLMTNIINNGQEVNTANRAPKTTGFKGNIRSLSYTSSNIVTLTIPKYIILQFLDLKNDKIGIKDAKIPKGTEFLVACIGGHMEIEHMRIIGLYTLTYEKNNFPELTDDYYGGNPVK